MSMMSGDSTKASDVRRNLHPIASLAAELGIAPIPVMHIGRGAGKASYKVSGSHVFEVGRPFDRHLYCQLTGTASRVRRATVATTCPTLRRPRAPTPSGTTGWLRSRHERQLGEDRTAVLVGASRCGRCDMRALERCVYVDRAFGRPARPVALRDASTGHRVRHNLRSAEHCVVYP
jgi:hypothetical protein